MTFDLQQMIWANDASRFDRIKQMYIISSPNGTHREWLLQKLKEIQAKWPQYIKASEIPSL